MTEYRIVCYTGLNGVDSNYIVPDTEPFFPEGVFRPRLTGYPSLESAKEAMRYVRKHFSYHPLHTDFYQFGPHIQSREVTDWRDEN